MNIILSDPTPKTAADIAAAYQSGYDQYPIDHPPVDTNDYFSQGYEEGYASYPQQNPPPLKRFIVTNSSGIIFDIIKPDSSILGTVGAVDSEFYNAVYLLGTGCVLRPRTAVVYAIYVNNFTANSNAPYYRPNQNGDFPISDWVNDPDQNYLIVILPNP